jgi:hypothetical protein
VKRCHTCQQTLPVELFAKAGKENGRQVYKSRCRSCVNEQMRSARRDGERTHVQNVREQVSPHGKGIVPVTVLGWGYARDVRAVQAGKRGRRSGPVFIRDSQATNVVVPPDDGSKLLETHS